MSVPVPVQVSAARANWRADLLRLHAAEFRRLAGDDSSPVALGLLTSAAEKENEADLHQVAAQVELDLGKAKAASHADPKDQKLRKAYVQAADEMVEMRRLWRGIGEATGTRPFVQAVDDFPEPSDDDVLASHGGAA